MYSKQVLEENWDKILEQTKIDYNISAVSYHTWLLPLSVYDIEDNILTIVAENPINMNSLNFIRDKYSQFIRTSIMEMLGSDYEFELNFILRSQVTRLEEERREQQNKPDSNLLHGSQLNKFTFDNFVVGDNNNFAHAAALAVAEQPGEVYNPLFIYGGSGLGKTHLMYAIANYILQNNPNRKVLYVTCETFTNDLIISIRSGGNATETFREKYRTNDILLIDDIQFIEGKESIQEEFFHTFNEMKDNGRQVVISSDKNPKDLKILDERLRSRFGWGLTVDVQPPSYETRVAILHEKSKNSTIPVYDDVLDYIAQNINSNIRDLEGALTQVVSMSRLLRKPITLDLAREALKDKISPNTKKTITPELILNVVAEHYALTSDQIRSKNKSRVIAYPRQVAMYLCREMTSLSFDEIGTLIGDRDHSTVHYAYNKVAEDILKDPSLAHTIEVLKRKINPGED